VVPWAFAQAGVALMATAILPTSAEGAWLVAVIAQLASGLPLAATIATAILQTAMFGWLLSLERPLELAVDVPIAWLGFQIFAALLTHVARSEAEHRSQLVERNVQLLATRQLLAERTRAAERLRMARDLHDGLGHHLSALSLNLEAAAHLAPPDAREHVARAQGVARAMLDDVRQTVSGVRDETVDPMQTIRSLVESIDRPVVHVDGPSSLAMPDPASADTITRVVQEIVTNAVRHAQARNLWISIASKAGGIDVEGRDDGLGAPQWRDGNGLRGMRERLALVGGSLDVRTAPGAGFEVHARIPVVESGS
jgi:signal transduction histidine kinase